MMKVSACKLITRLFLLASVFFAFTSAAQTLPEGARVNQDKCLGYEMDYKKYPKPVIAKVQADMYQLYHQDEDWKHDAGLKGKPLNDGILGPITWSWMQRFCNSFALNAYPENSNAEVVKQFPQRSAEVARFSTQHRDAAATLISKPFALWSAPKTDICKLDVKRTLAQGSDADLLALVRCYLEPQADKPQPLATRAIDPPHKLFVLREDDFEAMAKQSNAMGISDAIQTALREKLQKSLFADEAAATAAINPLLAQLPAEQQQPTLNHLLGQLHTVYRYQLDDQALAALDNMAISDALFNELNSLAGKEFADYKTFSAAVMEKIAKVEQAASASAVENAAPATGEQTKTDSAITTENPPRAESQVNANRLLVAIKSQSEKKQLGFSQPITIAPTASGQPIPLDVITLLKDLKDIEYPSSDLLRRAIKVRILKAADICDLDKSFVFDKYFEEHFIHQGKAESIKQLLRESIMQQDKNVAKNLAIRDSKRNHGEKVYCRNIDEKYINYYYDPVLANIVEKLYSEPMPAYQAQPILWSGSHDKCGCVPDEIQTMAYGIFPYWKTAKVPLQYDFSTFSRTAYFGLTADNSGKLKQIQGANIDVLGNADHASKAFIREARRYDSKVDWIIEKDFGPATAELNKKEHLEKFLAALRTQIISLLKQPLYDTESRLRPWLSLGLVGQPLNGDGITLYFKNLTAENFPLFEDFFRTLKYDLQQLDEEHNHFHPLKNRTYLNIMTSQNEYMDGDQAFNRDNLEKLLEKKPVPADAQAGGETAIRETPILDSQNLTIAEIQDELASLIVLIMTEPYYSGLDEVYAVTSSTDRAIIAPLMIGDYSKMDTVRSEPVDSRKKRIAYIHESFGAGAFWPMVEFANSSDGKNYDQFNEYIATHFSPGYAENYWNETLCAYRWPLIYVMNIWLSLAFIYLVVFFYLFPHRCRELPGVLRLLEHPVAVLIIIIPPILLWGYLQLMDSLFNFINFSSLLCVLLLVLAIWAGVDAIKALQQRKPNRNLLQMVAFPVRDRNPGTEPSVAQDDMDEEALDNERK